MSEADAALDLIRDFKASLEGLKASTLRVYLSGAKAVIKAVQDDGSEWGSNAELLAIIREVLPVKGARIAPFLGFLGSNQAKVFMPLEDSSGVQNWVVQSLGKRLRSQRNPSIANKRDMALIAALCVAPARGNPRNWLRNALKSRAEGDSVGKTSRGTGFRASLAFLASWRERLSRPDQRRLYRQLEGVEPVKTPFSGAAWPAVGPNGFHNALRRLLSGVGGGGVPISPRERSAPPSGFANLSVPEMASSGQDSRGFRAALDRV